MNSISETIRYAVPIVAIPIDADQPFNAQLVCDQHEIGVRLDASRLESDEIGDAIDLVLRDKKYMENVKNLSNMVEKYNGALEGAKLVIEYLNRDE